MEEKDPVEASIDQLCEEVQPEQEPSKLPEEHSRDGISLTPEQPTPPTEAEQKPVRVMVVANWQPYESIQNMLQDLGSKTFEPHRFFVALPYALLTDVPGHYASTGIEFGLSNLLDMSENAFTRPQAISSAKNLGASFVLVRSPREIHFHPEELALSREKIERLAEADLPMIVCVGESYEDYLHNRVQEAIADQIKTLFPADKEMKWENLLLVYQGNWWNHPQKRITLADAENGCRNCRQSLIDRISTKNAERVKILCGFVDDMDDISSLTENHLIAGYFFDHGSSMKDLLIKTVLKSN